MKKLKDKFINLQKFKSRYNQKCHQWKDGPVQHRPLNDHICVSILVILTIIYIGVGVYCINNYDNMFIHYQANYQQKLNQEDDDDDEYHMPRQFFQTLDYYKFQIMGFVLFSNLLAVLYIYFLKTASKLVIYVMIFVSIMTFLTMEFKYILNWRYDPSLPIILGFLIIVYTIIIACYQNQIKIGTVLIKIAGTFMLQRKIIFVAIFIKAILTFVLSMFWIYVLLCLLSSYFLSYLFDLEATKEEVLMSYWGIMFGFFSLLFYYFSVFNIGVIFSYWYFDIYQKFPLTTSWKWIMKYSIGSLTFAALLVSITKLFFSIFDSNKKYTKNLVALACVQFVKCLFSQAASLIQVFNHNAVICMALTGESFIGSAKTTLGIVGEQFAVISIISKLLYIWGFVFSVLGPTLIAYLTVGQNVSESNKISWIVFYFSSLMTGLILSILNQILACVIFFYCIDKRFRDLGLQTHRIQLMLNRALIKTNFQVVDSYMMLRG